MTPKIILIINNHQFYYLLLFLPINGPRHVTNIALPIRCQPNAAGNLSNEQYSDTVNVKFAKADPRKKPHIDNHTIRLDQSLCSANTVKIHILQ